MNGDRFTLRILARQYAVSSREKFLTPRFAVSYTTPQDAVWASQEPKMTTARYATDAQVEGAIQRWRGNVSAAADELGIQPKNLRKRLESLGIDLVAVRHPRGASVVVPLGPHGPSRSTAPEIPTGATGRESGGGPFRPVGEARRFGLVQAEEAVPIESIRSAPQRPKPLRLQPPNQDRLRQARLQVAARLQIDTDETVMLNQFFEEDFEAWLASKLGAAEAKPQPKRGKRGEEGA